MSWKCPCFRFCEKNFHQWLVQLKLEFLKFLDRVSIKSHPLQQSFTGKNMLDELLFIYMNNSPNSLNIPLHGQFHLISCLFKNTDIGLLKCKYVCVWTSNYYIHAKGNAYKPTRTYKILQYISTNGDKWWNFMVSNYLQACFFVVSTLKILIKYIILYIIIN